MVEACECWRILMVEACECWRILMVEACECWRILMVEAYECLRISVFLVLTARSACLSASTFIKQSLKNIRALHKKEYRRKV